MNMFNKLSIRIKLNLMVAFIFFIVIGVATTASVQRERSFMLGVAEEEVRDFTTWYFDSLNTMMLTGTMSQRTILREKSLARPRVVEVRVVRGDPVSRQFGPGLPEERVVDDLDSKALGGEAAVVVSEGAKGRILTVITPFHATENTRGVNCLRCHEVPSGSVNGAIRVSYSLEHMDANTNRELMLNVVVNIVLFGAGLIFVNIMINRSLMRPLAGLMDAVRRRADGDVSARAPELSGDELGRLAGAYNSMAESVDAVTEREHQTAVSLQQKVDALLAVVNRVTEGDFNTKVSFSGDDAIGQLGSSLQIMVDYIRISIEEKREAVEVLQKKVDALLTAATAVANGDLTAKFNLQGEDAIGQLGLGVRSMIDNLNSLVTQVQRSGVQVTSSATEIAATMKQVDATAVKQAATTNQIATTATEISATTRELANTVDEVAEVAQKATAAAVQSHRGLARMETLMGGVVEAAGIVAEKLDVLKERAANISTVVVAIGRVADQTNLLSLNAAIEAEKAGEYGRGFAVVAAEIRRLADQSAVSTLDIEQIIKEMQESVQVGVQSMAKFASQVRAAVNEVQAVSAEQSTIISQVETLGPRFESVHQSMHFQSKGAEQINQAIINLSDSAQQTVETLRFANNAIARLNDSARGLQQSVSKFKVLDARRSTDA